MKFNNILEQLKVNPTVQKNGYGVELAIDPKTAIKTFHTYKIDSGVKTVLIKDLDENSIYQKLAQWKNIGNVLKNGVNAIVNNNVRRKFMKLDPNTIDIFYDKDNEKLTAVSDDQTLQLSWDGAKFIKA